MARFVVVATSPVDRDALADHVALDDELFVVVPAVGQSRLQWLTNDEDDARAEAEAVGESIATDASVSAASIEVKSEVPSQAVLDAVAEHAPDRVLVALRTGEDATWLEGGELERLPATVDGVPVTIVEI
jgi:hypothetical protein